jgi:16S rRNA (uracil1498-N3)-methyltransferase
MYLFYSKEIGNKKAILSPEESRHCVKVLRLKTGDIVHLTDGNGNLYTTKLVIDHDKHCELEIISTEPKYGKRNFHLQMAVAPTKNISRFEWFLEKATEVGIDSVIPIICENSERYNVNMERLNKVVISAMKQSLKTYLPEILKPVRFNDLIARKTNSEKYIAHCSESFHEELKQIIKPQNDTLIYIGPEGDFSPEEIKMAINSGIKPVRIGKSRLRTETAALVACITINLINQ